MGKFFDDKNPLAGFEEYINKHTRSPSISIDPKEYEGAKTYSFLEFNYYRLKKISALLHKKLFNLGSADFFTKTYEDYIASIKKQKKELVDTFVEPDHPFQKRQNEIYQYFFTRK